MRNIMKEEWVRFPSFWGVINDSRTPVIARSGATKQSQTRQYYNKLKKKSRYSSFWQRPESALSSQACLPAGRVRRDAARDLGSSLKNRLDSGHASFARMTLKINGSFFEPFIFLMKCHRESVTPTDSAVSRLLRFTRNDIWLVRLI